MFVVPQSSFRTVLGSADVDEGVRRHGRGGLAADGLGVTFESEVQTAMKVPHTGVTLKDR